MTKSHLTSESERILSEYRQREGVNLYKDLYGAYSSYSTYAVARFDVLLGQALHSTGMLPLTGKRILDVGCGTGRQLLSFLIQGALPDDLYGIDLIPERIAEAKAKHPLIHLQCGSADQLDYPDSSFDLVTQFTVFSSILDEKMQVGIAREMIRVTKPGGLIVWYDLRRMGKSKALVGFPQTVVESLFPGFHTTHAAITRLRFGLSRRLIARSWELVGLLERLPFLCDCLFVALRKSA
jgi:ubiquinone/menaquinone biosynthesis C-methylase UbiE